MLSNFYNKRQLFLYVPPCQEIGANIDHKRKIHFLSYRQHGICLRLFDAEVYEELQVDAESLMKEYEKRAKDAGVADVHIVIEMGNPKTLLARTIPDSEEVDLILVGATGLNAFERLLVGSSSEYILRHAKVDLLVVREQEKTL